MVRERSKIPDFTGVGHPFAARGGSIWCTLSCDTDFVSMLASIVTRAEGKWCDLMFKIYFGQISLDRHSTIFFQIRAFKLKSPAPAMSSNEMYKIIDKKLHVYIHSWFLWWVLDFKLLSILSFSFEFSRTSADIEKLTKLFSASLPAEVSNEISRINHIFKLNCNLRLLLVSVIDGWPAYCFA